MFWTGNKTITYSEQRKAEGHKFTLLVVTFQYHPVFVTGGFRRFNELRKRNPEFKTLVAIGGWNEGSTAYSQVSHFHCVYIQIIFSCWYTGKAKCNVLLVNINERISEQGHSSMHL